MQTPGFGVSWPGASDMLHGAGVGAPPFPTEFPADSEQNQNLSAVVLRYRIQEPVGVSDVEGKVIYQGRPVFLVEPGSRESEHNGSMNMPMIPLSLQMVNRLLLSVDQFGRPPNTDDPWSIALEKLAETPCRCFTDLFTYVGVSMIESAPTDEIHVNRMTSNQRGGLAYGIPNYWGDVKIGDKIGFRLGWADELGSLPHDSASYAAYVRRNWLGVDDQMFNVPQAPAPGEFRGLVDDADVRRRKRVIIPVVGAPVWSSMRTHGSEESFTRGKSIDQYRLPLEGGPLKLEQGDYISVGEIQTVIGAPPTDGEIANALYSIQDDIQLHRRCTLNIVMDPNPSIPFCFTKLPYTERDMKRIRVYNYPYDRRGMDEEEREEEEE